MNKYEIKSLIRNIRKQIEYAIKNKHEADNGEDYHFYRGEIQALNLVLVILNQKLEKL